MMESQARILIVEDDVITAEVLRDKLQTLGHDVPAPVGSGEQAVIAAEELQPDLVLMDVRLAGAQDGIETAAVIRRKRDVPVIYLTAYTSDDTLRRARATAPYGYLVKPVHDRELEIAVDIALERHRGERQGAEEEEQRRVAESAALSAVRQELEALFYSISHDLKAPLRRIQGYTQILLEDHGGVLDEQGLLCASRAGSMAQQMNQMIGGILELSRITQRELKRQRVELTGLALAIAAELGARHPERRVTFVAQPGLTAEADHELLELLLRQLLDNAWKFTARTSEPRVELGALTTDRTPVFFVRDNGAGFDMCQAGRLYALFQRLHPDEDYPGSGIGLAMVKRIAARHGGRTWAEGEPGRGACVYFTLAAAV